MTDIDIYELHRRIYERRLVGTVKNQAAAILKNRKIAISPPGYEQFRRKFGTMTQFDTLDHSDRFENPG